MCPPATARLGVYAPVLLRAWAATHRTSAEDGGEEVRGGGRWERGRVMSWGGFDPRSERTLSRLCRA